MRKYCTCWSPPRSPFEIASRFFRSHGELIRLHWSGSFERLIMSPTSWFYLRLIGSHCLRRRLLFRWPHLFYSNHNNQSWHLCQRDKLTIGVFGRKQKSSSILTLTTKWSWHYYRLSTVISLINLLVRTPRFIIHKVRRWWTFAFRW